MRIAARSALAVGALLASLALFAGCGGGGGSVSVSPAVDAALKFLPPDAAIVAVVPTNTKQGALKQLDDLGAAKVKGWPQIRRELQRQVVQGASGAEVDAVLGNPIAFSASGKNSNTSTIAIQTSNPAAAKQFFEANVSKGKAKKLAPYKGVFTWQDTDNGSSDTNFSALKGNILIGADSEQLLHQAIDRGDGSDNLSSENDFKKKLKEMGESSLLRVVGDAQRILDNTNNAARARKVAFVKSLGLFSSQSTVTADGVQEHSVIETTNESLGDTEIPLAAGGEQLVLPSKVGDAGAAIAGIDHLLSFTESTLKAASPAQFSQYKQGLTPLEAGGIDVHRDVAKQIKQLSVSWLGGKSVQFRASLVDGPKFAATLDKTKTLIEGAISKAGSGMSLRLIGSGPSQVYLVTQRGKTLASFGVNGDALLGSVNAPLSSDKAGFPIPGATGALAIEGDIGKLATLTSAIDANSDPLARQLVANLGRVTTTISETKDGLTENTKLSLGAK